MQSYADKKNGKGKSVASSSSGSRQRQPASFQFADNRPEAVAQRQLAEMMNDQPQQLLQLQTIEEDELLQGKFATAQREGLEEEELLQGKFETTQRQGGLEEEELLQGKFESVQRQTPEDEELLQGKFDSGVTPMQLQADVGQQENNTGLPDHLKAGIENISGYAMDDVKVHYNSAKPAELQAHAYAQGTDIHVASGQEKHLPHEAWHVVQQKQGRVKPTMQMKGKVNVNDDAALEKEADVMGAKAMQRQTTQRKALDVGAPGLNSQSLQRVIQRGVKYDKLVTDAESDVDGGDYEFKSINDDAIRAATTEVLIEHLTGKKFEDLQGDELQAPNVTLSGSWGGAEGLVLLPARLQATMQIHTGEFVPNLMHEIGHMVKGQKDVPAMKSAIANIAKDAKLEAAKPDYTDAKPNADAWEEEVRADLTGVHLRWLSASKPSKDEYTALAWAADPADGEHPPGAYRIARISEYIDLLEKG